LSRPVDLLDLLSGLRQIAGKAYVAQLTEFGNLAVDVQTQGDRQVVEDGLPGDAIELDVTSGGKQRKTALDPVDRLAAISAGQSPEEP
jgi:hypothetical protein